MLSRLSTQLSNLLTKAKWALFYRLLFSLVFISPVIFLALFSYIRLQSESTSSILSQKKSLASLAATIVDERLDGMVDLGTSLATRPRFIEEIGKGNWTEAMNILGSVSNNFPSVERVVLYDPNANIKADMPAAGVTGQTRADKEWYISIKRNWQPHVSGVYQRSVVPKINVVSIVIPVKTGNSLASTASLLGNKEQKVIGILQLQLDLEIFADWIIHKQRRKLNK